MSFFAQSAESTRNFSAKADGYSEVRCPKKRGVIAAESCLEKQSDGCRCDVGIGALVGIRISASEEARQTEHAETSGRTREIMRRIEKAKSQLAVIAHIESGMDERELKLIAALTPADSILELPPIRALCEKCGNGCWGANRLCAKCIAAADRPPPRFCKCGKQVHRQSLAEICSDCRPVRQGSRKSMLMPPTEMECEVYRFVEAWITQNGKPPLPYQVSTGMKKWAKFGSCFLNWLRQKGYVEGRGFELKLVRPLPVRSAA